MTSSSGAVEKVPATFAIPTFTGKEEDYDVWKTRFGAYCMIKDFNEALESKFMLPANPRNRSSDAAIKATEEENIKKNSICAKARFAQRLN